MPIIMNHDTDEAALRQEHHRMVPGARAVYDEENSSGSEGGGNDEKVIDSVDHGAAAGVGNCSGDDGEAGLDDDNGDLDPEEYEYMKEMMDAMEDGFDEEEEEDLGVDSDSSSKPPAAPKLGDAAGESAEDGLQDGNEEDNDDEEEYAMAMMHAMEDGIEGEEDQEFRSGANVQETLGSAAEAAVNEELEDEEYAMAMMNAMEDGSEEPEEGDAAVQDNREQVFANRHVEETSTLAALGQNILETCSSLTSAVREYYRMSQGDQLQVWDDLVGYQGQRRVFVEGKELPGNSEQYEPRHMVETALRELSQELRRMPTTCEHRALDLALEKYPKYVLGRKFLLKFLRAEKFDIFAAATRMCRHFEIKLELFGETALGREIKLNDLDEDDMEAMKSGYIQVLQGKDVGHRPVIFYYKAVSSECYKERTNIVSLLLARGHLKFTLDCRSPVLLLFSNSCVHIGTLQIG